jgi:hypothetical protein
MEHACDLAPLKVARHVAPSRLTVAVAVSTTLVEDEIVRERARHVDQRG